MSMPNIHSAAEVFRNRVLRREPVYGTFIKTPTSHATEILGALGFDFVVIDAEHAPFGRAQIDQCILAARAAGIAPIVRVACARSELILAALDDGAFGVMVPHITDAKCAHQVVAASRYAGQRGFSNSPRSGEYGQRSTWEHIERADREALVIGMIEDPEAVDNIDEIASVDGLDCVFVGRGDLTAAYRDCEINAPRVRTAAERVLAAVNSVKKPAFLLAANALDAQHHAEMGVTGFLISSDQGFLKAAAGTGLNDCKQAMRGIFDSGKS
ncbi:hypothetical protein CAP48_00350 [Advenella sp. S44]|uniref:HpcH/HpaI aldolase family protein n=1 Tax=Advenella sp. S44 TaxID=1982755 RepID=UPI000C29DBE0|nr:aldolase/citrate lyase family protein [Advenella sp. S44]PJX27685.1 hypothetical protein CAP48_00350 [Advenella sp. S44]